MNARSRPYSSAGIARRVVSQCGHVGVDNEGVYIRCSALEITREESLVTNMN